MFRMLPMLVVILVAGAAPQSSPSKIVVQGYPYAGRCPRAGYADRIDRWGMYMCNCTSYVAWALHANGQRTDWFIPGAMDAENWPHVAQLAHLQISNRPRVRSVVVWPKLARPFGHLAYVTRVDDDGGIDVSEYNLPGTFLGPYLFDERHDVPTRGAEFIYVPRRRSGSAHGLGESDLQPRLTAALR